jgi:hypothetical protein
MDNKTNTTNISNKTNLESFLDIVADTLKEAIDSEKQSKEILVKHLEIVKLYEESEEKNK